MATVGEMSGESPPDSTTSKVLALTWYGRRPSSNLLKQIWGEWLLARVLSCITNDARYDIADYKAIDPAYGSLEDVDELIAELKKRDMRLMMDLVVNHTSNEHDWFLESRSSKLNPKRDWYIWKPPKSVNDGVPEPPNNWAQILGEANSAWTYDEKTGEYYLSIFTPEQPDLNWENPEVRAAVWDVMNFWLERGCAGFRMDVINMISKVKTYPDAEEILDPATHKYQPGTKYFVNGPKLHDYLQEMNGEVLSKHDSITVGEMPGVSDEDEILRTVGANAGELRMIFVSLLQIRTGLPREFRDMFRLQCLAISPSYTGAISDETLDLRFGGYRQAQRTNGSQAVGHQGDEVNHQSMATMHDRKGWLE